MKKIILSTTMMIGLSVAAYGQGSFILDNVNNLNYSQLTYDSAKTTGGLIFTTTTANQYGNNGGPAGNQQEYADFNVLVLGGPTAGTCNQLIAVWLTSGYGGTVADYCSAHGYTQASGEGYTTVQNAGGINFDAGLVVDPLTHSLKIPGVTGTGYATGYLDFFIWEGNSTTYSAAQMAANAIGTTGVFAQTVAIGLYIPQKTDMMPDVLLAPVPEPSAISIFGACACGLLMFRRTRVRVSQKHLS
jgi:hypothetical protein